MKPKSESTQPADDRLDAKTVARQIRPAGAFYPERTPDDLWYVASGNGLKRSEFMTQAQAIEEADRLNGVKAK